MRPMAVSSWVKPERLHRKVIMIFVVQSVLTAHPLQVDRPRNRIDELALFALRRRVSPRVPISFPPSPRLQWVPVDKA
jgi:hypothetical protein